MSAVPQEAVAEPRDEQLHITVPVTAEVSALTRTAGALAVARAYEIDCPEVAQSLSDDMRGWAKRIDQMTRMKKDLLAPVKRAVEEMQARLSSWFDAPMADLVAARELGGQKLLAWQKAEEKRVAEAKAAAEEEERKRRQKAEAEAAAARAKAEEAARIEREKAEAAEAERQRLAEAAEAARREGDEKAAREADRLAKEKAEEAAKAQQRETAALENGAVKAQQAQLQAAAVVTAPVAEVAKISGASSKSTWVAELEPGKTLDDAKRAIAKAIASGDHDELLALIDIDMAARGPINKLAAALKSAFRVPCFKAVEKTSFAGARK